MTRLLKKGAGVSLAALMGFGLWLAPSTLRAAPTITDQPQSQSVAIGLKASFSVTATGQTPFTYRWSFKGTNLNNSSHISGATNAALTVSNTTLADAGNYRVVINDQLSQSTTSSVAVLAVGSPPVILTSPVNVTRTVGTSASFTTYPTGTELLNCRWRLNGVALPLTNSAHLSGVTNTTLNITAVLASDAGAYTIIVTNQFGATTNLVATLTVNSPPVITNQPVSQSGMVGGAASFSVGVSGSTPLSYRWRFNGIALSTTNSGRFSGVTNSTLNIAGLLTGDSGNYTVVVTNQYGSTTSSIASLSVAAFHYVNLNNPTPVAPYTSWSTAATNIQSAVDVASPGDQILVTNGVYFTAVREAASAINCVAVTNALSITSVNGPDATSINGQGGNRCVYLASGASLTGFTLVNGFAYNNGGGVYCQSTSAVVANCVFTGNRTGTEGGGVYSGTLTNCTLTGNTATIGGGAGEAILNNCRLTFNTSVGGGGAIYSTLNNCVISSNRQEAPYETFAGGGGVRSCTLTGCILTGNIAAENGGAAVYATMSNCVLTANSAFQAGGAYVSGLYNCILSSNTATQAGGNASACLLKDSLVTGGLAPIGGGANNSALTNCTVTGNTATSYGGGVDASDLKNCIVYFNSSPSGGNFSGTNPVNFCCLTPLPVGGTGNFTNAPQFAAPSAGNYRLYPGSPCINAGDNASVSSSVDLDGKARMVNGVVDLGAYEFQNTPFLTLQPQSQTVRIGEPVVTFGVSAFGPGPFAYQWLFNGTNIADATNSTLALGPVQLGDAGSYSVLVVNSTGTTTSTNAVLSVSTAAFITLQPASQTNGWGNIVTFTTAVSGDEPLFYQWFRNSGALANNARISGANSGTLTLTGLTNSDAGGYQLIVSNHLGASTSVVATLTVLPAVCARFGNELAAWWRGEGNVLDAYSINDGTVGGTITYAPGRVGQAINFDGASYFKVAGNPGLNVGLPGGLTLESWIRPAQFALGVPQFIMEWNNGSAGIGVHLALSVDTGAGVGSGYGNILVNLVDTSGASHNLWTGANVMALNTWQHVAVTYHFLSGQAVIYRNGQVITNANLGSFIPRTSYNLYLGDRFSGSFSGSYFYGMLDEPAVYKRALSPAEILSLYTAGSLGKCATQPPYITEWATNFLGIAGSNVTLTVGVGGVPPFRGQWFFNGGLITNGNHYSGADSTALTILGATTNDIGSYQVIVVNDGGSVTSSVANLSLLFSPGIITPPAAQVVNAGSSVAFHVVANGDAPLTYRWRRNGIPLADSGRIFGSGTASLVISNLVFADTDSYDVVVSNSVGMVVSPPALLTVATPPILVAQPVGYTNAVGSSVAFAATVTGSQPITHQWLFNSTTLTNDVRVTGATTTNLVIANLQTNDTGAYQLISANAYGAVTSLVAFLEVDIPPVITQSAASRTNVTGSNSIFTVTATGSTPLWYQWYFNNIPLTNTARISGSTSDILVVSDTQNGDAGSYRVTISNLVGSASSTAAVLTVVSPPTISQQPANLTGTLGYFGSFTGAATGTQPIAYQWLHDGAPLTNDARISGANSASLTLTGLTNSDAGGYQLVATNYVGASTSAVATLTVVPSVCAPFASGLAAWWPGEGNIYDVVSTNDGLVQGAITFAAGKVRQGLNFNGGSKVKLPASGSLNVGTNSGLTLEAWVRPAQFTTLVPQFVMEWNNGGGGTGVQLSFSVDTGAGGSGFANILVNVVDTAGASHAFWTGANALSVNTLQHVAVTYHRSSGMAVIYRNGQAVTSANLGSFTPQTSYDLYLGGRASGPFAGSYFSGVLDDAAVYNRALSPGEILSLYTADDFGKCVTQPPRIVQWQTNLLGAISSNITLNVSAAGVTPLVYQWLYNGGSLTNDTHYSNVNTAALTIVNAQASDIGGYQVVVVNSAGSVTSSVANLNLLQPPSIITPPFDQAVAAGSNATFSVVAGGDGPFAYRWRRNGVPLVDSLHITGSFTDSLVLSTLVFADTGSYDVLVSNDVGAVISVPAMLTVNVAPVITAQPTNRAVALGMPLNLTVTATGTAPLAYQWSLNGFDLSEGTNATYAIPAITSYAYGVYQLVATNAFGAVTSAPVQIVPSMVVAWGAGANGQTNLLLNLTNIVAVSAGGIPYTSPQSGPTGHNLALRVDGTIITWGININGTNGSPNLTNIVAISAGGQHNLALRGDGKVIAWGNNSSGQTNVPVSLSNVVAIAAGGAHSVALRADGKVIVWGSNFSGQTNVPASLTRVVTISAGASHTMAVRADGTVVAWGLNSNERQGTPGPATVLPGLKDIRSVAGGYYHDLALGSNGTVVSWASTNYGLDIIPAAATNVITIAAGSYFNTALRADNRVTVWGRNDFGQTNAPAGLGNVVAIAAGPGHVLALINDGRPLVTRQPVGGTSWTGRDYTFAATVVGDLPLALQWQMNGTNIPGATNATLSLNNLDLAQAGTYQLLASNPLGEAASVPVPLNIVSNGLSFLSALPSAATNYVGGKIWLSTDVAGNGPVNYQWRFNGAGIDGATNADLTIEPLLLTHRGVYSVIVSNSLTGDNIASLNSTQQVAQLRTWGYLVTAPTNTMLSNIVAAAASYAGAGSSAGYYWALGTDGKLNGWGTSSYNEGNIPAAVSNSVVTAVAAGLQHALVLRPDGTVVRWGYPTGQLQTNPAAANNVVAIACGDAHDVVLRSDGTVFVWGTSTFALTNVPGSVTNIVAVAGGSAHCLALRADGRVIGWGSGTQTNVPPTLTNVIAISAGPGAGMSVALRADGTVTNWGSIKPAIPTDWTNIVAISSSYQHISALRADGVVLTAGNYFSGVAVVPSGTENVIAIASGGDHDLAVFGPRTPAVTIQPFGRRVARGAETIFLARSVSPVPASYQWLFNGTSLLNETNQILTVTNAQLANLGDYQFVVNNSYGSATSKVARLLVSLPLGESVDTSNPNWDNWSSPGGLPWFGQITTTHDGIDAAQSGGIGHGQETILQTLVTNTTLAGGMASFWWKVSSEAGLDRLEFRLNGALLATNSGESGWAQRTFEVPIGASVLQWRYSKNSSNSLGADTAWVDQFDITFGPPVITSQPTNQTVMAGNGASFNVVAAGGGGSLTYSWVYNLTNAVGGNNRTLALTNLTRTNRGTYACIVSNSYGAVVSSDAVLNVMAPQSLSAALLPGGGITLSSKDADGGLLTESDLVNFEVQASETLQDWSTLTNALSITNGMLILQDYDSTNHPLRFYRIIEH